MTVDYRLDNSICTKLGLNPELCESIELWLDRTGNTKYKVSGIYNGDIPLFCTVWYNHNINKTEIPIEETEDNQHTFWGYTFITTIWEKKSYCVESEE